MLNLESNVFDLKSQQGVLIQQRELDSLRVAFQVTIKVFQKFRKTLLMLKFKSSLFDLKSQKGSMLPQ